MDDIISFASHQEFREAAYALLADEFSDCGVDDATAWKAAAIRGRVQYFDVYGALCAEIKLKDALKEFITARYNAIGETILKIKDKKWPHSQDEAAIDRCVAMRGILRQCTAKIKQLEDDEQ